MTTNVITQSAPRGGRRGDLGAQGRLLAQSVLLEEAGPSRLVRTSILLMVLAVAAFLAWASVARVHQAAMGPGQVIPTGAVMGVQHLEGGIVKEILVRDGDIVEAGAPLIRLEPTAMQAQRNEAQARLTALELKAERLRSFLDGRPMQTLAADRTYGEMAANEEDILRFRTETRDSKRAVLNHQIVQRQSELEVLAQQETTLKRRVELLREASKMREQLVEKGLVSRIVYLNNLQDLNTAEGELSKVRGNAATARAAIAEARGRLLELEADSKSVAVTEFAEATAEIARLRALLARLDDQVDRLDIVAPVRGVVKGLKVNTIGGVIPAGGLVTEIVPAGRDLVVEGRLSPRDIGQIRVGQKATVKFSAYDAARFGGIDGVLEQVSATTFEGEHGEKYYKAVVRLAKPYVGSDPARNPVLPGMLADIDVSTGDRTLLQYLVRPAYDHLAGAFTER
ncbi:MAG: HlyD family type I secretion periplasmic adaptor subunit [Rhodospirillales bacterium]